MKEGASVTVDGLQLVAATEISRRRRLDHGGVGGERGEKGEKKQPAATCSVRRLLLAKPATALLMAAGPPTAARTGDPETGKPDWKKPRPHYCLSRQ